LAFILINKSETNTNLTVYKYKCKCTKSLQKKNKIPFRSLFIRLFRFLSTNEYRNLVCLFVCANEFFYIYEIGFRFILHKAHKAQFVFCVCKYFCFAGLFVFIIAINRFIDHIRSQWQKETNIYSFFLLFIALTLELNERINQRANKHHK